MVLILCSYSTVLSLSLYVLIHHFLLLSASVPRSLFLNILNIYLFCSCEWLGTLAGKRTSFRSLFSLTMWVPGIKLILSGLATNALPAPTVTFWMPNTVLELHKGSKIIFCLVDNSTRRLIWNFWRTGCVVEHQNQLWLSNIWMSFWLKAQRWRPKTHELQEAERNYKTEEEIDIHPIGSAN